MRWSYDRTGYPVLELPAIGRAVQLLPVAKRQFERFLAEPGAYGDAWYEALLAVSPRTTLDQATTTAYEMLFATGIFPPEAQAFAAWLGQEFGIPKADNWRDAFLALLDEPFAAADANALEQDTNIHRSARQLLSWIARNLRPRTWAHLGLMRGGLLEWVRAGQGTFGGFGVPRTDFQAVIINPERDSPVRPVYETRRYRYFGFRLMRPLEHAK